MKRPSPLIGMAIATAIAAAIAMPAAAQPVAMSETDMVRFMVQSLCADASGQPIQASPIDASCVMKRAQTLSDPATYSKHDWANIEQRPSLPQGYQASDAVISAAPRFAGDPVVIAHTFDFGGPAGGFGAFSAASGDGGQVAVVERGAAAIFMTQDGGSPGLQWFTGDGCRTGQRPQELAWLLFTDAVNSAGWTAAPARLSGAKIQSECPASFSTAYTRYIRATVAVPFLEAGEPVGARDIDTIISEHYDLQTLAASSHLERFYLGKDLGMMRWERWEHPAAPSADIDAKTRFITASGRCPALSHSAPPGPGWFMVDCRTWTNITPVPAGWSVGRFGWEGLNARPLRR